MYSIIDGLEKVTCILGSFRLIEEVFLLNGVTNAEFKSIVLDLYIKILTY